MEVDRRRCWDRCEKSMSSCAGAEALPADSQTIKINRLHRGYCAPFAPLPAPPSPTTTNGAQNFGWAYSG